MMKKLLPALLAALLLGGPIIAMPAAAEDRHERHEEGRERHGEGREHRDFDHGWRDRDIHRFHDGDFGLWREGRWFHGRHGDRLGWWWIAGGSWYFYPQPIYPYPDPYRPPVVAGPPPPAAVYYFCPRPRGYYPYVPACPSGWQAVPAG
ncbi:MAG: hypothetical protein JWL84_3852 [Rhodospirillales bacterium]|nr:hypothetical protein [Rhodospirillales bacterium]